MDANKDFEAGVGDSVFVDVFDDGLVGVVAATLALWSGAACWLGAAL